MDADYVGEAPLTIDPLPLDLDDLIKWWMNHPEGSRALYHHQGYEGLTSDDRVTELYLNTIIDYDLEIFYCISVRWRPYLAMERSQEVWNANPEIRDHLFVAVETLSRWPGQTEPAWRSAWMGTPHRAFEEFPSQRDVLAAFMDFIEDDVPQPCTPLEANWCPRHGSCTCHSESDSNGWEGKDAPDCPLHSLRSEHPSGRVLK